MSTNEQNHPFDKATTLTFQDGVFKGKTSEAYANMVGPFGGVIASQLLQAVIKHPDCQGEPIALTINYAAPVIDGDFIIKANPARTNRSTQHWVIELSQADGVVITGTALFANRRKTWSTTEVEMPDVSEPEKIPSLPSQGLPTWVRNYDIKIVRGIPNLFSESPNESEDSVTMQWVQDKPKRPLDFLSLAAMSDSFFPRIFVRRNKMVPAGTVSLTIYFHADAETLAIYGSEAILGNARALRYNDGFFDQTAEMWAQDGTLLATTSQIVYYRD